MDGECLKCPSISSPDGLLVSGPGVALSAGDALVCAGVNPPVWLPLGSGAALELKVS